MMPLPLTDKFPDDSPILDRDLRVPLFARLAVVADTLLKSKVALEPIDILCELTVNDEVESRPVKEMPGDAVTCPPVAESDSGPENE